MSCERYSDWMSLYIDQELGEKERVIFEDHISNCGLCRKELNIFQDIMKDMKDLEMIELPEFFHQDLMEKLKVTSLPVKNDKWYLNLRFVSAIAAVFIFSTILINPLKTNAPHETLEKSEDKTIGARMVMDSAPESTMAAQEHDDAGPANTRSFDESILEIEPEMWMIETVKYEAYKEAITKISEEMNLGINIIEELGSEELKTQNTTIEIGLEKDQKSEFQSKIKEVDETLNIIIKNENEQEDHQLKIVISISQLKE